MQKIEQNRTTKNRRYERKYKTIDPARVLDLSITGIAPLADDEFFVESHEFKSHFVSCYGRLLKLANGEYRLVSQYFDNSNGGKPYYCIGGTTRTAASLVVNEFIENPYSNTQIFVWYLDGDFNNTYYKNLFPLTPHYYNVVKVYSKNHDFLTGDIIVDIMNEEIYVPSIYGVGYWGTTENVDTNSDSYKRYINMLERCYYDRYHKIRPAYAVCDVCEEWKCYANFRKWWDSHYYEIEGERVVLDKDILKKTNTVYGPDFCSIVPESINLMFSRRVDRTNPLPVGVYVDKKSGRYKITCNRGKGEYKQVTYATVDEAFSVYKSWKEAAIKELAEKYKGVLEDRTYQAMVNWRVEITD